MKVYKHQSHTAIEIKPWKVNQTGIILTFLKSKVPFFPIKQCKVNWKLYFKEKMILLPFFRMFKGNRILEIGLPQVYLTFYF